ncbi:MAG: glycosyltransferase [Armatimonadetes bacterium]|nr:glycosyltransferase [Armatimonadota bacterium]
MTAQPSPQIVAVIPTHNELEELRRVIESIEAEDHPSLCIVVVNAGAPLPEDLCLRVRELRVDDQHYWAASAQAGFDECKRIEPEYVYLTNADTCVLPGTINRLAQYLSGQTNTIACGAAYLETDEGVNLLYSHQIAMGFLLYGKLIRPWRLQEEAPAEPFEIELTGGQCVLMRLEVVQRYSIDAVRFPQTGGDHDLWLNVRKDGYRLMLVPQAGVVNTRILSAQHAKGFIGRIGTLARRMTSEYAPESWRIMWRLRRKHLSLPLALLSTVISFAVRWTIGLPKMLRRT